MNHWAEDLQLDMDLYTDLVKIETAADLSPELPDISPLHWDDEKYSWEELNTDLFDGALPALPISVETQDDQHDISGIPSPTGQSETSSVPNHHTELMLKYGLSDDQLGDMTLKQLKKCCSDEQDYSQLKSYRRTCLNRGYARSSRSKQQKKTNSLSVQLTAAEEKIQKLNLELEEKNLKIQYLELENRLLLGCHKND